MCHLAVAWRGIVALFWGVKTLALISGGAPVLDAVAQASKVRSSGVWYVEANGIN